MNHPPVITVFIGGMLIIPSHWWVLYDIVLPTLHPNPAKRCSLSGFLIHHTSMIFLKPPGLWLHALRAQPRCQSVGTRRPLHGAKLVRAQSPGSNSDSPRYFASTSRCFRCSAKFYFNGAQIRYQCQPWLLNLNTRFVLPAPNWFLVLNKSR